MGCALIIAVWTVIDYTQSSSNTTDAPDPYQQAVTLWLGSLTNFLAFNIVFECTRLIAFGFFFHALLSFWKLKKQVSLSDNENKAQEAFWKHFLFLVLSVISWAGEMILISVHVLTDSPITYFLILFTFDILIQLANFLFMLYIILRLNQFYRIKTEAVQGGIDDLIEDALRSEH